MTEPSSVPSRRRHAPAKQATWGGLALAVLVALYSFAQPILNEQMGWDLPAVTKANTNSTGSVTSRTTAIETATDAKQQLDVAPVTKSKPVAEEPFPADPANLTPGPLAKRVSKSATTPSAASPVAKETTPPTKPADVKAEAADSLYGILKPLGSDRYLSPAGLMYTRGSAEGHRLDHLERHTVDDPGRPGKHGVFDGGLEGALKWIDRAYERAKTGQRTTKEVDQGRIIYTVDMGSRVGYIGGRDGNRLKKPMARRVRLVLDDNRVITAFPL